MLHRENAIRIDKYYPKNPKSGPKNQYIFKCALCNNEIKVKSSKRLETATGLCVKCNNASMRDKALAKRRLRPFEALWNRIKDSANRRSVEFELSYEDFLIFTTQNECHYCLSVVVFNKYGTATYNLDRKDSNVGYFNDNLVVCCFRCNKGKREIYSYEEWYNMTAYFRDRK